MAVIFTVEDGSIVGDANSYCTVDFADDYLSIKSNSDDWIALDDDDKEKFLMWATRLLDQRATWQARTLPTDTDQALDWPRMYVVDENSLTVPDDIIPQEIQEATVEIAFNLFNHDVDPSDATTSNSAGAVKRIKAAVIEIEYTEGVVAVNTAFPKGINDLLLPFGSLSGVGGSRAVPIRRA